MSASVLEVAEAMYQAGKSAIGPKMPDSLDELAVHTQKRYLLLAEAAISVTGPPAGVNRQLLDDLAEQLAYKLLHPQAFVDGVRHVLVRYIEAVGDENVSEEVRRAAAL